MMGEIGGLLRRRGAGHAVDIVVAVAFDVAGADKRCQHEVLLERQARLRRQVLGGHERACGPGLGVPHLHASAVDECPVEAFAGLRGDAGITERAGTEKCADIAIGLVDFERHPPGDLRDRPRQRLGANDRLLEEERRGAQFFETRLFGDPVEKIGNGIGIFELLVAVERHPIRIDALVEDRGDGEQTPGVLGRAARNLDLEITMAIGGDHLFQSLRQSVLQPLPGR